jgi:hypothetical protein
MSDNPLLSEKEALLRSLTLWLERLTAGVLLLVVAAVAWMVFVASQPDWLRLGSVEVEAVVMLGLLTAALLLVTVVALLHTRRSRSW